MHTSTPALIATTLLWSLTFVGTINARPAGALAPRQSYDIVWPKPVDYYVPENPDGPQGDPVANWAEQNSIDEGLPPQGN